MLHNNKSEAPDFINNEFVSGVVIRVSHSHTADGDQYHLLVNVEYSPWRRGQTIAVWGEGVVGLAREGDRVTFSQPVDRSRTIRSYSPKVHSFEIVQTSEQRQKQDEQIAKALAFLAARPRSGQAANADEHQEAGEGALRLTMESFGDSVPGPFDFRSCGHGSFGDCGGSY